MTTKENPAVEIGVKEDTLSLPPTPVENSDIPVEGQLILAKLYENRRVKGINLTYDEEQFINNFKLLFNRDKIRYEPNFYLESVIAFLNEYHKRKKKWPDPMYMGYPPIKFRNCEGYYLLKRGDYFFVVFYSSIDHQYRNLTTGKIMSPTFAANQYKYVTRLDAQTANCIEKST